jgi:thiosulfate reductase cytochrome b subunit
MSKLVYLYPRWLRIWHWTNAALFVILLVTGTSMHFATPGGPQMDFRSSRLLHNASGILLTAFYLVFLIGNFVTRNGRYYRPQGDDLTMGWIRQARYYAWGIFRGEPHPFEHSEARKFNPLQKITYLKVMYVLFPLLAVTGWLLFFPERLPAQLAGTTGVGFYALAHTALGYAATLFMLIHMYLGTTGESVGTLFRAMLTGYHPTHEAAAEDAKPGAGAA